MVLAQHAFAEQGRQALYGVDLVAQHLAQRDAGPAADDLGDGAAVDQRVDQWLVALHAGQLGAQGVELRGIGVVGGVQRLELFDQRQLLLPLLVELLFLLLLGLQGCLQLVEAAGVVVALACLVAEHGDFGLQVVDLPAAVFQGTGLRRLRQGDARTGGVEHADGLVRQLATSDVAVGKAHRLHQGLVHHRHLVVLAHLAEQATKHVDGLVFVRLFDLDHLEAAGEGGVLLEVLLVLGPGGRGDGAQLATGQGWLEQVGGIVLPGLAAGTDQGVGFVDEQDDRVQAALDLFDHGLEAVLELALDPGTRLQQAQVEGV